MAGLKGVESDVVVRPMTTSPVRRRTSSKKFEMAFSLYNLEEAEAKIIADHIQHMLLEKFSATGVVLSDWRTKNW